MERTTYSWFLGKTPLQVLNFKWLDEKERKASFVQFLIDHEVVLFNMGWLLDICHPNILWSLLEKVYTDS